uniref:Transcription cofactor vestigial-like protein 4 n=1 Tax=Anopheles epiroticus TaxID=199890 RepID=A0A182PBM4_9DIPT
MIRDPGGTSPNENQDSPPSPKYDRILGRPPPLDDTEIPLDMTVRRKDSSDGQGSPTAIDQSRDGPINLNVRPSVITKAPPPPIKKRISHMHTNGEIVLKSSIRTTTSTTVESAPIVNVSSTYCDVSIEEHFRRSLGPTYSSIYGDKHQHQSPQQQQQQQQPPTLNVLNNNISTGGNGPPPFVPESPVHHLSSDPAPPIPLVPASVLPPSPGAPSSAASVAAISLTSPKHLHQQPPPAAISPASLTTTMSLSSSSPSSSLASSPAPFLTTQQQKRPGSGEEVDDHFAKALGETWKKIQESNMNL